MELSQFLIWFGVFLAVSGTAIIDPKLQHAYDTGGYGSPENVMISFDAGHAVVIEAINKQKYSSLHEKRSVLTQAQQELASETQGELQKFLKSINVHHETFWINNKMYVPSVSSDLAHVIANFPGVAKIEKELVLTLDPVDVGEPEDFGNETIRPEESVEWGIEKIHAPKVWSKGVKGKGIVVANIDTGVHYTHEALKDRWRTSHGWFSPYKKTEHPFDENGHGTHTMGTIAGTHGVGVAPEATWIACQGCSSRTCDESGLIKCGQWIQCPTNHLGINANCKLAPDLVSNSWGGGQGGKFYDEVIASWQAAGIIPIFSIGNSGAHCGTANSPGDRDKVIAVGSIDKNNRISVFSSCGPSVDKRMKPEIVAPGGKIRSAWYTSDTAYNTISGTSMSCPHVSGVVGLIRQKRKHLSYADTYKAITTSANHNLDLKDLPKMCGDQNNSKFPNNIYGHGLICAEKAVGAV